MGLPPFDEYGLLPPGDYPLTLPELKQSMLVNGPAPAHEPWDAPWRAHLVDNLGVLVQELWTVGMTEIFIDGSFVEDKAHPNDIDGYFACDLMSLASGELQRQPNRSDDWRTGESDGHAQQFPQESDAHLQLVVHRRKNFR